MRTTFQGVGKRAPKISLTFALLFAAIAATGWNRAKRQVVIGDGAAWIWNIANEHFPTAVQIVDLYHARQHLWELSASLFASDIQQR
jgi:hypothetical protein